MPDTETPAPAPYVENPDHVPDPLAHVGTVDTTGTGIGPHTSIEGVNPAFDIERERLRAGEDGDLAPVSDWYAKAAAAGGTQEYQDEHSPSATPQSQTFAVSSSDVPSDEAAADPNAKPVAGTVDTTDTSGVAPSTQIAEGAVGNVEGRDDLNPTAVEAAAKGDADLDVSNRPGGDTDNPPAEPTDGLDDMTIAELRKLAGDQDPTVEIPSDTTKHDDIAAFLRERGLRNPEAPAADDGGDNNDNPS